MYSIKIIINNSQKLLSHNLKISFSRTGMLRKFHSIGATLMINVFWQRRSLCCQNTIEGLGGESSLRYWILTADSFTVRIHWSTDSPIHTRKVEGGIHLANVNGENHTDSFRYGFFFKNQGNVLHWQRRVTQINQQLYRILVYNYS